MGCGGLLQLLFFGAAPCTKGSDSLLREPNFNTSASSPVNLCPLVKKSRPNMMVGSVAHRIILGSRLNQWSCKPMKHGGLMSCRWCGLMRSLLGVHPWSTKKKYSNCSQAINLAISAALQLLFCWFLFFPGLFGVKPPQDPGLQIPKPQTETPIRGT